MVQLVLYFLFCGLFLYGCAESTLPKGKQTTLGLYVTAKEAHEKWQADPDNVKILDVRTPEEYVFVGHAPMAHNIPLLFFKEKWYAQEKGSVMMMNPDFVSQVKKKCKPTDTILVMCRSGGRSAKAVNLLANEGFKQAYNVIDGFEGGIVKEENSYYRGKRKINGWKNSGAPWTYKVNPKRAYPSVL